MGAIPPHIAIAYQPKSVYRALPMTEFRLTMSDYFCFLITLLQQDEEYGYCLLQCALRVKRNQLPDDCYEYPEDPENKKALHNLLPEHVRSVGPILRVEFIFDVHIADEGDQ